LIDENIYSVENCNAFETSNEYITTFASASG
jgi:hypothetical protein